VSEQHRNRNFLGGSHQLDQQPTEAVPNKYDRSERRLVAGLVQLRFSAPLLPSIILHMYKHVVWTDRPFDDAYLFMYNQEVGEEASSKVLKC
jgi:hypothetical protein